ncbi:PAS domain-containing protein [Massilia sp. METH4]|uniref:PAS domain-containing protein n=1 Tax=Massilia sp. METH4 TaxID=3123041 RepID=UPI0030CD1716
MSDTPEPLTLPASGDLFVHAPCALLLTDTEGAILRVNATAVAWLGYSERELVGGMDLLELFSIGGGVYYQSHCLPLLQLQQSVSEVQIDLVRRDGTRVPALLNVARQRFEAGLLDQVAIFVAGDRRAYERELQRVRAEAHAALAAREDVEEKLRTAIRELSTAEQRRADFLLTLCHDLRNPLAPMRSGVDLMKATLPPEHPAARFVAIFDRQLRQLVRAIDELAETARYTRK